MQIQSISNSFSSSSQLACSFLWATIEELRASLLSEMQSDSTSKQSLPLRLRWKVRTDSKLLKSLNKKHPSNASLIHLNCKLPAGTTVLRGNQFILLSYSSAHTRGKGTSSGSTPAASKAGGIELLAAVHSVNDFSELFDVK